MKNVLPKCGTCGFWHEGACPVETYYDSMLAATERGVDVPITCEEDYRGLEAAAHRAKRRAGTDPEVERMCYNSEGGFGE